MTIRGLTQDDSGIYTVEVNSKETSKTQLLVISPVPKPTLTVSYERTYCLFTCDGDITGAEPITYWWTAGEKRWNSTKELKITEEDKEQWFICTLENPVSSNSSEKVSNPLMKSDYTWIYILISVLVVCTIIIIPISYFKCKKRKGDAVDEVDQGLRPQWEFEMNEGWRDFNRMWGPLKKCSVTNDDTEKRYQEDPQGKMRFKVNEDDHELDFKIMIQTNLKTGNKRNIRRVMAPPPRLAVSVTFQPKGRSAERTQMRQDAQKSSNQRRTSVVARDANNAAEMAPMLSTVREPSKQDRASVEVLGTRDGPERPGSPPAEEELSIQYSRSAAPPGTSNETGFKPQWQFARKSGGWRDFKNVSDPLTGCSITNNEVEKQYQENPNGKIPFKVNGNNLELDLKKRIQTNLTTKTKRRIRRVLVSPLLLEGLSMSKEVLDNSNRDERPESPPTSAQDTTSAEPPGTSNEPLMFNRMTL